MILQEEGIILVNKPKGKTSRDIINDLCHLFNTKKIGHTGTLDPIATGVLVVCIGKYTKLVSLLSGLKKEYIAMVKLGIKTDTLDITGKVLKQQEFHVKKEDIIKVLKSIIGKYKQEIPLYSAKKVNGKKLYEYARNNEKVKLPINEVEIYDLDLISFQEDIITFKALVSKGTYIRSLIQTICDKLNTIGTMCALERTMQGKFKLSDSYSISDIQNGVFKILKAKDILPYKVYEINDEEYFRVSNGNKIKITSKEERVIIVYKGKEIAIYQKYGDLYKPEVML